MPCAARGCPALFKHGAKLYLETARLHLQMAKMQGQMEAALDAVRGRSVLRGRCWRRRCRTVSRDCRCAFGLAVDRDATAAAGSPCSRSSWAASAPDRRGARDSPVQAALGERVRAHVAAGILGVEVRTVQALAARGEVPGAAKIGGLWTFDEAALRNWIRERTTCQKTHLPRNTAIGGETRSGRDLPLQAAKSAKACEQALRELRRSV